MDILNKIILGICDTHDASATLVKNGKIICAIAEERVQRVKSVGGYPKGAIQACLDYAGIKMQEVDYVALAGNNAVPVNMLGTLSTFSMEDFVKIQEEVRKPQFYDDRNINISDVFPDYKPKGNPYYSLNDIPLKESKDLSSAERKHIKQYRLNFISKETGVSLDKIHTFDHHSCHAYYAYYASPFRGEKVVVITLDSGGDGIYESISIFDEKNNRKLLHASKNCIIGPIYSMVTLLLRMRPFEHEFKVMGMAPYAKEYTKRRAREIFSSLLQVKGIKFKRDFNLRDFYFHLGDLLKFERFDGIAGGLQDWVENTLKQWFKNIILETKTGKVIYSGGVALNVKANQSITEIDELESLFVPPGCGDESLSIGAVWLLMDKINTNGSHRSFIEPLKNGYLGNDFGQRELDDFDRHKVVREKYARLDGSPNELVANAIANNEIVAICRGRMEFGPRSLGHRSLIANPSSQDAVVKINEAIKGRDFWMPFAPSIIAERVEEFVNYNSKADLSYMTFTVNSKENAKKDLVATLHPYDHTLRLQSVSLDMSPDYYNLLKCIEKKTGLPGVLNTSLNIHGKPIVMKPVDIANELLNMSGVELENILVGNRFYRLKK
jgi:carbamoyltransferase